MWKQAQKLTPTRALVWCIAILYHQGDSIGLGAKRSTNIGNVEDVLALDIRVLRRLGVARPGECKIDTLQWRIGGLNVACVRLRVDLSDIERSGGNMSINGTTPDGPISQRIAVDAAPAPMGGHRCYYICPITGGRAEVLYYAHGRFASRAGQRLSYEVQGMNALSAARRKVAKLRRRLKGEGGTPRPRGLNREEIKRKADSAAIAAKALYFERLGVLADRSGTLRMPRSRR